MLKKSQRLTVRFSPGEQQKIELAAYASGVTPSEFVRMVSTQYATHLLAQIKETA